MEVPNEILFLVLEGLDGKSFYRLRQTCRSYSVLTDEEYFRTQKKEEKDEIEFHPPSFMTVFEIYCSKESPQRLIKRELGVKLYEILLRDRVNISILAYPKTRRGPGRNYLRLKYLGEEILLENVKNKKVHFYVNTYLAATVDSSRIYWLRDCSDDVKKLVAYVSEIYRQF
ncbi:hypothetical protein BNJ_00062 [Kaumoebavirus]|uniref:hypothetical protein n=1 Tax=Kaumoebavirus TaxID=1859492 RepID=UPI0009C1D793|nr:hypothetical protein BNJ_00062 [Kaumoebavirus]ARA71904.1 hypothetical protein BNJ_00062 [Kaumoebavirus]